MFTFPKNKLYFLEWMNICNISSYDEAKIYRLCERHFAPEDIFAILTTSGIRRKLKIGAIPINEKDTKQVSTLTRKGTQMINSDLFQI